jgi:hypothetical protein
MAGLVGALMLAPSTIRSCPTKFWTLRQQRLVGPDGTMKNRRRRVVVTGVGLVSPPAVGTEPTRQAILGGRSGIGGSCSAQSP